MNADLTFIKHNFSDMLKVLLLDFIWCGVVKCEKSFLFLNLS